MSDITFRLKKIKKNPLLQRVQMVVDVIHPNKPVIKKQEVRNYLVEKFKKKHIVLFGFKKVFGGGRTTGYCLCYDNEDAMKKYDTPARLRKMRNEGKSKDDKEDVQKGDGRKIKKNKKNTKAKKWGTKRRQDIELARKMAKEQD